MWWCNRPATPGTLETSCCHFVMGHCVIPRCYTRWCIRQIIEESDLPMPKASGARLTVTSWCAMYTWHILYITFHKVDPSVQKLNATTADKAVFWDFGIHACKFEGFLLPTTDFWLVYKSLRNKQTVMAYWVWGMLAFGRGQNLLESIWYSLLTCISYIPSI